MSELIGRSKWRDGLVSLGVLGFLSAGIWLASGRDGALGHGRGDECLPVCHWCADIAGKNERPGAEPLARHCVPGCPVCGETHAAGRRLEHALILMGGMEPG